MTATTDAATAGGWTITYQAALPAAAEPRPFMQAMLRAGMDAAQASTVRADLDWTDTPTLQAWASAQPNAVLLDVYTTAVTAIEANQDAVLTFRQALANLLTRDAVSLDALGFLHGSLTQALTKASHLAALASSLHRHCGERGMAIAAQPDNRALTELGAGAVISRETAQLHHDNEATGTQLVAAMQAVTVLPDDSDHDERSPFEELQAVFSIVPA